MFLFISLAENLKTCLFVSALFCYGLELGHNSKSSHVMKTFVWQGSKRWDSDRTS